LNSLPGALSGTRPKLAAAQGRRIGLLDASSVDRLTVSWPTSRTTQTFTNLAADQMIEITGGAGSYRVFPQRPFTVPAR
jgi:ASPIC and UnbV